MPSDNAMVENNIDIIIPFRKSNAPITSPNSPVVKKKMIASCTLTIIRRKEDAKNTKNPSKGLYAVAIAIGSVLHGLKTIPRAGKKTGAEWNSTAIAVNMPPIHINLTLSFLFK